MHYDAKRFNAWLSEPLRKYTGAMLALLVIPLLLSFTLPLWRISMSAPQYPNGLTLDIYAYTVTAGNEGRDLAEINTLNHYIGMRHLDREAFGDLDWIPFALGGLAIFALRIAVIGEIRGLVDLVVLTFYVSCFAFGRFVYTLYAFGHHLRPDAPVKVPGFMPAVLGQKQIANFSTESWPQWGSILLLLYAAGVLALLLAQVPALRKGSR
jgi:copper chaperone NosL